MYTRKIIPLTVILFLFITYVIISSLLVYNYQHTSEENIFSIKFCFGPVIENIVTTGKYGSGMFNANRMPFLPLFLSGIALIFNNLLFAYFLKNFIFFSLITMCIYIVLKRLKYINKYTLTIIALFALSFPQLVLHGFSIDYEEGYLIAFISLLFVNGLYAKELKNKAAIISLSLVNALIFLTKSSMLPLSIAICFFYYLITKKKSILFIFLLTLFISFMAWGSFNLYNSGKFNIRCSFNGYNFYKGNNEHTLKFYPKYSIDKLNSVIQQDAPKGSRLDEWEWDQRFTKKAFEFIKNNPVEEIKLILVRTYVMFFRIVNTIDDNEENKSLLKILGMLYMLMFRIIFFSCLFKTIKNIFTKKDIEISFLYLGFILFYSVFYLLGFAYERHVMPLVAITIFYLIWLLDRRAQYS